MPHIHIYDATYLTILCLIILFVLLSSFIVYKSFIFCFIFYISAVLHF